MNHEQWLEQHDRMLADHHVEMAAIRASHAKLEESQAKTEKTLRWAIRLAVEDARRQRKRNAEFAESGVRLQETGARLQETGARLQETMDRLAIAQLHNEQLLKAILERGGNGKH